MLNEFAKEVHENAVEHGWWSEERSFGEIIALCHSELSEALEEYRTDHKPDETYYSCKIPEDLNLTDDSLSNCPTCPEPCQNQCKGKYGKPEGIPSELADCIIRILDYCGKENIDIDHILRIKHEYNKSRPYRHGGKKI